MIDFKFWRKKRKLTRIQLALLAGTSVNYLYEIENWKKTPSMNMVEKLSKALDIRICVMDLLEEKAQINSFER